MKILIINSEYPPIGGGASNASAQIADELVALGQQVIVFTAAYGDLPREEESDGVHVVRLAGLRKNADRSTTMEQISFMLSASLLGLRHLRKWDPDVVLAFFGAPSGVAPWFWSFFMRLPYIVSLRGGDVPGFRPYDFRRQHKLLSPLLRSVWRRAKAVVANSEGLRMLAVKFEPDIDIAVVPNGVNLERFIEGSRIWSPPRLLFVGRVVYQKGLDLLFKALSELQDLEWELDIAGDGPRLLNLQDLARQLGIGERVHFLGWQSKTQLPAVYAAANIFVYPSRHEGMPNALLEAMASGLPALATSIAGNEELVTGETGLLAPSEDVPALREALRTLLADEALRTRLGAAARKRVAAEYSWRQAAQAYLDLMNKIVNNE